MVLLDLVRLIPSQVQSSQFRAPFFIHDTNQRESARLEATRQAKTWLTGTLRAADALHIGHGPGPVHHCHDIWKDENDWKDSDR